MVDIAQAQISNPSDASGSLSPSALAEARDGLWGYRFSRQSASVLQADTVGPTSAFNGQIVLPDLAVTSDISTQNAMNNSGASTGATVASSVSTTFAVYWCAAGAFAGGFGFSTSAPVMSGGLPLLNSAGPGALCLFLGWIRTSAAGALVDTAKDRHVINYWNRRPLSCEVVCNYNNNNAATTYFRTAGAWAPMSATAADAQISFLGNDGPAVLFAATFQHQADTVQAVFGGIGLSTTTPLATSSAPPMAAAVQESHTCTYSWAPSAGALTTVSQLCMTGGAAVVFVADLARAGAAADPPATYMRGLVWG